MCELTQNAGLDGANVGADGGEAQRELPRDERNEEVSGLSGRGGGVAR